MTELSWQLVVLILGALGIVCWYANARLKILTYRPSISNNPQQSLMGTLQPGIENKAMQYHEELKNKPSHSFIKHHVFTNFIDEHLKKEINMFFSGSKSLEIERNIFNGAVVRLHTKWGKKGLSIYGHSYQSFNHEVVDGGPQEIYNDFIQNATDAIFFVLNGNVGKHTNEEFRLAMEAFKENGTPKIFIYSKINDVSDSSVEELRKSISKEKQYWQDYTDNTNLKLLIESDMAEVIEKINDSNIEIRRNILE